MAMHSITVAKHEFQFFMRERTVFLLLIIFLGMALASAFIGWSSQHTIQKVYAFSANQLSDEGRPVPPSPLANNPHLFMMRNMIIYIVLIGSLLAISVGNVAGISDRKSGTVRVLFAHPISRTDFIVGKIIGIIGILLVVMLLSAVISALSSLVISTLTWSDLFRLIGFYGFSFVFLLGFGLLGLSFGLLMKTDALALLIPIIIWITVIFVLPGLASALYPTASLNLVQPISVDNHLINGLHAAIIPISVSDIYKSTSENILQVQDPQATTGLQIIPVVVWSVLCMIMSIFAIRRFSPTEAELNE